MRIRKEYFPSTGSPETCCADLESFISGLQYTLDEAKGLGWESLEISFSVCWGDTVDVEFEAFREETEEERVNREATIEERRIIAEKMREKEEIELLKRLKEKYE